MKWPKLCSGDGFISQRLCEICSLSYFNICCCIYRGRKQMYNGASVVSGMVNNPLVQFIAVLSFVCVNDKLSSYSTFFSFSRDPMKRLKQLFVSQFCDSNLNPVCSFWRPKTINCSVHLQKLEISKYLVCGIQKLSTVLNESVTPSTAVWLTDLVFTIVGEQCSFMRNVLLYHASAK